MKITPAMVMVTAIQLTVIVLMISLGMETTRQGLEQLWRKPRLLAGALVAAFVVVPLVAYGLFRTLPLSYGAKVGLWAIAIAPGAPMIYRAAVKKKIGDPELAASFQVTVALLVIILAPIWLAIISAVTPENYWIPPRVLFKQVSTVQFIPLLIGMTLQGWRPALAAQITPLLVKIGQIALSFLVVILLVALGPRIITVVQGWTILAAALMAAAAIIGGHLLTGPALTTRLTIANANAQRNPGLALTLIAFGAPLQKGTAEIAVVVYMVIAIVMAVIYTGIFFRTPNHL